jgi:hypothetical protein
MNRGLPSPAEAFLKTEARVIMPSPIQEFVGAARPGTPRKRGDCVDDVKVSFRESETVDSSLGVSSLRSLLIEIHQTQPKTLGQIPLGSRRSIQGFLHTLIYTLFFGAAQRCDLDGYGGESQLR